MYLSESLIVLNTIDPAFCKPQATGKTLRKVYILNKYFPLRISGQGGTELTDERGGELGCLSLCAWISEEFE